MEVVVQASIQYLADHYIIKTLIDNGWYSLQKCLVWYNTPNEGGGGGGDLHIKWTGVFVGNFEQNP